MKLLIFFTVFNAFFLSRIATSFLLPPSRPVPNMQKRIRLPEPLNFPPTESKTRDFALQALPNNDSTSLVFGKLDPTGVYSTYLVIAYIGAICAIQNLLHNPDAGDINRIVLKTIAVFWIATSLFVYDSWYLFMEVLIGDGFFEKVYFFGVMALTLILTLFGIAYPVILNTAKLEGLRFVWRRLNAAFGKKKEEY